MNEPFVDGALRRILSHHRQDPAAGGCPGTNEMAAWLDARLSAAETERFEKHASVCPDCSRVLGLCLQGAETNRPPVPEAAPRGGFAYRTSSLRLVFAAVVLVVVGVLLFRSVRPTAVPQESPIANRQLPSGISGGSDAALSSPQSKPESQSQAASRAAAPESEKRADRALPVAPSRSQLAAPRKEIAEAKATDAKAKAAAVDEMAAANAAAPRQSINAPVNRPDVQNVQGMAQTQIAQQANPAANVSQVPPAQFTQRQQAQTLNAAAALPAGTAGNESMTILTQNRVRQALAEARSILTADAKDKSKRIGVRTFYRTVNYWVDADCLAHAEAPAREISRDSSEYKEIAAKEKDLAGLEGAPILLFLNNANCLIR